MLTLLKMPAWEPQPRMFKQGQSSAQGESAQKAPVTSMDKQRGAAREKQRCAMPIWWMKSDPIEIRKSRNNKIGRLLRWTLATRSTLGEGTQKVSPTRRCVLHYNRCSQGPSHELGTKLHKISNFQKFPTLTGICELAHAR